MDPWKAQLGKFHINCCCENPDAGWGAYNIISISSRGPKNICEHVPNKKLFLIKKSYVKQINVFLSLVFLEVGALTILDSSRFGEILEKPQLRPTAANLSDPWNSAVQTGP